MVSPRPGKSPTRSVGSAGYGWGMEALAAFVRTELAARSDSKKAAAMAAYMKTSMPFYGVQKAGRTEIWRELKRRFPITDARSYRAAILALWVQPHREEKYLAIRIAVAHPEFHTVDHIDLYRRLITEGAWWDFVDEVAIRGVGSILMRRRPEMKPVVERWIDDDDMWIRRASLLSQIKHQAATDHIMLFDHCLRRAEEREFFIRKAIGWALREYAKTEPDRVRAFLLANRAPLSGLSFREASKHLDLV